MSCKSGPTMFKLEKIFISILVITYLLGFKNYNYACHVISYHVLDVLFLCLIKITQLRDMSYSCSTKIIRFHDMSSSKDPKTQIDSPTHWQYHWHEFFFLFFAFLFFFRKKKLESC